MLDRGIALAGALNAMTEQTPPSRRLGAAQAEQLVRLGGEPHHVHDPGGLLGLDPLAQVPLRLALARLAHSPRQPQAWALLLPRPGRMAGLRGPAELNRQALACGLLVTSHDGELGWLGRRVGEGVQWQLTRAERPAPPPDPRESARLLGQQMTDAAKVLAELGLVAGDRPSAEATPRLGEHYPHRSQLLLERAWLLLQAGEQAMAAQGELLHSHAVLVREHQLRALQDAALDAITAAASWPGHALPG